MKRFHYEKADSGITLTVLVITVIVLIILAGTSINMLSGEQGILKQAEEIVDVSAKKTIEEEIQLAISEAKMEYTGHVEDVDSEKQYIEEYLNNYQTSSGAYLTYSSGGVLYKKDGQNNILVEVDYDKGIIGEMFANATANTIQEYNSQHPELHIPTGFAYKEGTVDDGYVISDDEGNEFVWIPVASPEAYAKKLGSNNWHVKSESLGNDHATTLENDITMAVQGDVLGVTSILGQTVIGTLDDNQPEAEIVNSAGGFWVGRYETGIANTAHEDIEGYTASQDSIESASKLDDYWEKQKANMKVKLNYEPVRMITHNKALAIASSWKSGGAGINEKGEKTVAFQSGLITGTQWDTMCNFIGWSTCDTDCSNWGNYANMKSLPYTGYCSGDAKANWIYNENLIKEKVLVNNAYTNRFVFPTGKFVNANGGTTVKNNIFDVAGNVWEWTTETPCYNTLNRIIRGGGVDYNGSNCATFRHGYDSATSYTGYLVGFRIVLYVK